jgi:hypothetical protein
MFTAGCYAGRRAEAASRPGPAGFGFPHRFPLGAALCVVNAGGMNVIDLNERRRQAGEGEPVAVCPCGEAWFVLRGTSSAPDGAVCMTADGVVTGYAGRPHCLSCGRPYVPRPVSGR